jgi:subtilisin family serine protease
VGARGVPARPIAVGYTTPASLAAALRAEPARVLRRIPALRVAEVQPAGDAVAFTRGVRRLPGIRYVDWTAARASTAEPALGVAPTGGAYEWQYVATHANAVPATVQRAASAVTIAVVDTGADVTAPDIAAKSPVTYSVVTDTTDVHDTNGHGTFVASLAAGSVDNGDGIAGFGGDAKLMVVQANHDETTFTDVDEANAIVWAVDNGARVINLSLGGPSTSRTERTAVDYAADHGVLLVAAAGNEFGHGDPVEYPAALLQPVGSNGVGGRGLSVGASTLTGARASFSNSGSYISLVAPGVNVLGDVSSVSPTSSYPRIALPGSLGGLYGLGSGTSYAAPQVAGAAALVWAANPLLTASDVAQILKDTATRRAAWSPDTGWGVLDVAAAVTRASGGTVAQASVQLQGTRTGRRVSLSWSGEGAAAYRLNVSEDGLPAHVLATGATTRASFALTPGHVYVFTVDAVDPSGTPLASSAPYRIAVAATSSAPKRLAARPH